MSITTTFLDLDSGFAGSEERRAAVHELLEIDVRRRPAALARGQPEGR